MCMTLEKHKGDLELVCEVPSCKNKGEYLFGEKNEALSRKIVLCRQCVEAIQKSRQRKQSWFRAAEARWVSNSNESGKIHCSNCGAVEMPGDSHYYSPRCPQCGRKMKSK